MINIISVFLINVCFWYVKETSQRERKVSESYAPKTFIIIDSY